MKSFHNHVLLRNAMYVGTAETKKKYSMYDNGNYPYVDEFSPRYHIKGELYRVTPTQLESLDRLEGYIGPRMDNHYYRKMIDVSGGKKAYMYFYQDTNSIKEDEIMNVGDYREYKNTLWYFAYGSNMSLKRMISRVGENNISKRISGTLKGYELVFNKIATHQGFGYANIELDRRKVVEGVLYELKSTDVIEILDSYEGIPTHYQKEVLTVYNGNKAIRAIVYVANTNMISENILEVSRDYANHLLNGKDLLSPTYFKDMKKKLDRLIV